MGREVGIQQSQAVGGGCIHEACFLQLECGDRVFAKTSPGSNIDPFDSEASGLQALASTGTFRIPDVLAIAMLQTGKSVLVLEAIQESRRAPDYFEKFARQLAGLHRAPVGDLFGFETDNFIGATPQPNSMSESWSDFFARQRLAFQLRLAGEKGFGRLQRDGMRLVERIDRWIPECQTPSLIHGDLWSGNYLADENGGPVLIDPAPYYADREAELGMTTLFGGLPPRFYEIYNEVFPLNDGYQQRVLLYKLYHLLNHLNLFGNTYLADCETIVSNFN